MSVQQKLSLSIITIIFSVGVYCSPVQLQIQNPSIDGQTRLHWKPLYEPGSGGWISSVAVSPYDPKHILVGGDILGVGLSVDGGETWEPTFGLANWEIADFTFHPTDPNIVWAGTMGGPYISIDGGRNWQTRRKGFPPASRGNYTAPIQKVLFNPDNPNRLLAFGGSHRRWGRLSQDKTKTLWGAVWESRDGGNSWKQIAIIGGGVNIVSASFGAGQSDLLYIGTRRTISKGEPEYIITGGTVESGVYMSTDGGRRWVARNNGLPHTEVHRLVAHPSKKDTLWVALDSYKKEGETEFQSGGIYKSTDGGATWTPSLKGLSVRENKEFNFTSKYRTLAVAPSNPDILLTCDAAWGTAITYKSIDGGTSWRPVLEPHSILKPNMIDAAYAKGTGPSMTVIEFDPKNAEVAFMAGSAYMLRTSDGGKIWTDVTAYKPNSKSPEWWRGRGYSGLGAVNFAFNPFDPKHAVLLAMDDGKFWESRDGLQTWRRPGKGVDTNGGGNDVTFAGKEGRTMYVTFGQGMFRGIGKTTDAGQSWKTFFGVSHGLPEWDAPTQPAGIHALPEEPDTVWATIGGKLYHSTDGNEHWSIIHEGPMGWIAARHDKPRSFYVSGSKGIYFTEDGKNFKIIPGGPKLHPNPWHTRIALDRAAPPRLYVAAMWRDGLWRLEKDKWTQLKADEFISNVAVDPTDPNRIAITTQWGPWSDATNASGVWISKDGGKTWSQQNEGLSCLRGRAVAINPHNPEQLIFGSDGCGYFITQWLRH